MTYSEKLKDPRWQKKRLEILNRDEWTCQQCFSTSETSILNVHHLRYFSNLDPWDYDAEHLLTLCKECHGKETLSRKRAEFRLLEALKKCAFSEENINILADAFFKFELPHTPDIVTSTFGYILVDNKEKFSLLVAEQFEYISEKLKKTKRGKVKKRGKK